MEENTTITIKKSSIWKYATVTLLVVLGVFFFVSSGSGTTGTEKITGNAVYDGTTQKVVLSMKNANYYPNTIRVKEGIPVSVTLDSSVQGCGRSLNIKDLGVREYSQDASQTIKFTPTKKGTFTFACSMGMFYGKIIVE